ncbi:MAG: hypothetical protein WC947_05920 [Elusimicrobiota bacterium]
MSNGQTITFQKAVDIIDSLPEEQQESIIDIVRHRLLEHRREKIAQNIKKARKEFSAGKIRRGTVKELMREIS